MWTAGMLRTSGQYFMQERGLWNCKNIAAKDQYCDHGRNHGHQHDKKQIAIFWGFYIIIYYYWYYYCHHHHHHYWRVLPLLSFFLYIQVLLQKIVLYITFTINWIWICGHLHKTVFPNRLIKGMTLNTFDLYNKLWTKSF